MSRVGGDHGGVKIYVGRVVMVEDTASIVEVGETESAETEELEEVELGVDMANSNEESLDLFEVVEVTTSIK